MLSITSMERKIILMSTRNLNPIRISLIQLFMLIIFTSAYQPVRAETQKNINKNSNKIEIQYNQKEESGSDKGRPTQRRGMASRNDCPSTDIQLTALIPENRVSKVVEEKPTFWLFIPYQQREISVGEFILQDEANHDVYRTAFRINKGEGIVGINLDSGKYLETNKIYQWYFKLYCNGDKLSKPVFVRGWVQRIALEPKQRKYLDTATTSRQRVAFYAQNGIWYSALTELAKLRQANPQNQEILARDWFQLLSDIDLQELSSKPIVGSLN
jgi:hypothetical protein